MSDITARLRAAGDTEAADEIERLKGHAVLTSDRDVAHLARLVATDLREIVAGLEAQ